MASRFCEVCGRAASADARFCGACGRPLDAVADAADDGEGEDARPRGKGAGSAEETVFELRPVAVRTVWMLLLCVVTVGIAYVVLLFRTRAILYRVTTQRLEVVTGYFSLTRRTVELFRVTDLEVREPFFLRMRGAGHLVVRTQDVGEAEVVLEAIPDVGPVHEAVRALVAGERRRLKVRVVEEGEHGL